MKKTLTILGLAVFAAGIAGVFSCGNPGVSPGPFYSTDEGRRYELIIDGGEYILTDSRDGEVVRKSSGTAERSGNVFTLTNRQTGVVFTVEVVGTYIKGGTLWEDSAARSAIWNKSDGFYSGGGFTLNVDNTDEGADTDYTLTYDGKTSTGTAKRDGGTWTLRHENGTFEVDFVLSFITEVRGIVCFDDGTSVDADDLVFDDPGSGGGLEDGIWEWSCSNDDVLNPYLANASLVPPLPNVPAITARTDSANWAAAFRQTTHAGAKSKISNAIKNEEIKWFTNLGGAKVETWHPATYDPATTVAGPNGVQVPGGQVLRFIGVTEVSQAGRAWDHGTQFPMVGWMATPQYIDDVTVDPVVLAKMRAAKGYSFWVKVNSATGGKWAVKTAILTADIKKVAPERGLEWKHYFGNEQPNGAKAATAANTVSGVNLAKRANWTGNLATGQWHQIRVYYDGAPASAAASVTNTQCNIEQDSYIFQYNIERRLAFNKSQIEAFQWQVALQDQLANAAAGVSERSGAPYDITTGSFSFNIDFYGLELIE